MKNKLSLYISFLVLTLFLFSCSNDEKNIEETNQNTLLTDSIHDETITIQKADTIQIGGAQLMRSSDCYTCHADKQDLVGPSFLKISLKYSKNTENVELLSTKIIKGGQGVWGKVPMQAHPALSRKDVAEMLNYIWTIN